MWKACVRLEAIPTLFDARHVGPHAARSGHAEPLPEDWIFRILNLRILVLLLRREWHKFTCATSFLRLCPRA